MRYVKRNDTLTNQKVLHPLEKPITTRTRLRRRVWHRSTSIAPNKSQE